MAQLAGRALRAYFRQELIGCATWARWAVLIIDDSPVAHQAGARTPGTLFRVFDSFSFREPMLTDRFEVEGRLSAPHQYAGQKEREQSQSSEIDPIRHVEGIHGQRLCLVQLRARTENARKQERRRMPRAAVKLQTCGRTGCGFLQVLRLPCHEMKRRLRMPLAARECSEEPTHEQCGGDAPQLHHGSGIGLIPRRTTCPWAHENNSGKATCRGHSPFH